MFKIFFQFIVFAFCIAMLVSKKERKLILLLSFLLLVDSSIPFIGNVPFFNLAVLSMIHCLMFCCLFKGNIAELYNSFPLKKQLIFIFLISLIIGLFSICVTDLQHKISIPLFQFTGTYLILFLVFINTENSRFFDRLALTISLCLFVLTFVGIINFKFRFNPYLQTVQSSFNLPGLDYAHLYTERERFRVNSLFAFPFYYGYVCVISLLYLLYASHKQLISKWLLIPASFCAIWGIIFCNCRIIIYCAIIALISYVYIAFPLKKILRPLLLLVAIFMISYSEIPAVKNKVESVTSIFWDTEGTKVSGSSLDMRAVQFAGAIKYFYQAPWVGNGYNYISKGLGWKDQDSRYMDTDMAGFESVIFQLMIEKGLLGIIAYLIFYISIITYILKRKNTDRKVAGFGVAVFLTFILFSITTGELNTVPITLFFLTLVIKVLYIKSSKLEYS